MELTLGSETSAFKTQTPGNNPEDYTLYSQRGESLKSTISHLYGEETTKNIRLIEKEDQTSNFPHFPPTLS
jgi:hypothetical protein